MRRGITYSLAPSRGNEQGFKSIAQIINKTAMGSIWETARKPQPWVGPTGGASKKYSRSRNRDAGAQFVNNLGLGVNSSQGYGRGIRKAWAKDEGKVNAAIVKSVEKMVRLAEGKING
jgi:hypothetical protein